MQINWGTNKVFVTGRKKILYCVLYVEVPQRMCVEAMRLVNEQEKEKEKEMCKIIMTSTSG